MRRLQNSGREIEHLLALAITALVARILIYPSVAVNGDIGLYLYDAQQILWGRSLFIDFPSRSPVMQYLLAGVLYIGNSPFFAATVFMVIISLVVGIAVYIITRQIHSHRAGLVAAAIFWFTPFSLVWGMWVKTEPVAALFVLVGFVLAFSIIHDERLDNRVLLAIGVLFGLAFLVRRVVIIHFIAFGLFALWYRQRNGHSVIQTMTGGTVIFSAATAVVIGIYGWMASFDLSLMVEIARVHAMALVSTSGNGGLSWVGLETLEPVQASQQDGMLDSVCQKCGEQTARVVTRTLIVSAPVWAISLIGLSSYTRTESRFLSDTVLPVAFVSLGILAAVQSAMAGYLPRTVAAVVGVGIIMYIWLSDCPSWSDKFNGLSVLPMLVIVLLAVGYLYRDRILYVDYFMDFMPFLSILAGIALIEFVDVNAYRGAPWRKIGMILLLALSLIAMGASYPFLSLSDDDSEWMYAQNVEEYGDEFDSLVNGNERVLTAQPLYVLESDVRIAGNLSRGYYAFRLYPGSNKAAYMESVLLEEIDSGEVPYIVEDSNLKQVFNESQPLQNRLDDCYIAVDGHAVEQTGSKLYEWGGCDG